MTKKIISLILVIAMICSIGITVFATNDYTQGTQVEYVGTGAESYTITVPAELKPGQSGTVTLSGTWANNRIVTVTADPTVTLTNSIKASDQKVLDVTFAGISEAGSNTGSQTFTETVSVDDITNALFGTWSGKFNYNVDIVSNTLRFGEKYILTYVDSNIFGEMEGYGYYYSDGSSMACKNGVEETWEAGTLVFSGDNEITVPADGLTYIVSPEGTTLQGYYSGKHIVTWTLESEI